jgi:hypothetical protein
VLYIFGKSAFKSLTGGYNKDLEWSEKMTTDANDFMAKARDLYAKGKKKEAKKLEDTAKKYYQLAKQTQTSIGEEKKEAKEQAEELRNMYFGFGLSPNLLLGENWLINSKQVKSVHPAMGGTLITD